jgi:hypothetical protein
MLRCRSIFSFWLLCTCCIGCFGYQLPAKHQNQYDTTKHQQQGLWSRRAWMGGANAAAASALIFLPPSSGLAAEEASSVKDGIQAATKTLQTLLDNWENAVVDCNYADVPRELLEQKNKEQLLEKASTFALFDKSVSVVTCKTSNRNIRDYIGRTGIGPVVGLDKKLRKALDLVDDPDDLETFVQAMETVQQALSKADSYSYTAGGDFSAVNNFEKEETAKILEANVNLKQVRQSVQIAVDNLNFILVIIEK